jgi:hypothetical protein
MLFWKKLRVDNGLRGNYADSTSQVFQILHEAKNEGCSGSPLHLSSLALAGSDYLV